MHHTFDKACNTVENTVTYLLAGQECITIIEQDCTKVANVGGGEYGVAGIIHLWYSYDGILICG
jgi:hypothetical protein